LVVLAKMSERLPPFFRLTDIDHGGVAVVASLCMIVISLSIASIRFIVAARQNVKFQYDDASFYLASVSVPGTPALFRCHEK
jgi:hypothetical protein